MKKLLFAFVLLFVIHSNAQVFEWQTATHSGASIQLTRQIAVLKDESFTTAFSPRYDEIQADRVRGMSDYIECANGATVKFNPAYRQHAVIANVAKNGIINWKQDVCVRKGSFELLHIFSDTALNSYVLLYAVEMPLVSNYDLIYIPSGKFFYPVYSEEEEVDIALTYGIDISRYCNDCMLRTDYKINFDRNALGSHWLLKIDAKGKIRWIKNSPEVVDDLLHYVYDFKDSGNGSFCVISEDNATPHFSQEIEKRKTKYQYHLAKIDTGFTINWNTNIISSSKKGDYTQLSMEPLLTLDENGNIIVYINYQEYMTIEREEYNSKERSKRKSKQKTGGSFMAVFDSSGKLRSAINSKSAFYVKDMAARNNRIYLPITDMRHNQVFSEKIDTSGFLQSVLVCLDYRGKLLWKKMDYNVQYKNIEVSEKDKLYVMAGMAINRSKKEGHAEFHSPLFKANRVKKASDTYVFVYDKTGEELYMKTIDEKRDWQDLFRYDLKVINDQYSLLFGVADFGCIRELKEYTGMFTKGKGCNNIGFWCKLKL